MGLLFQRVETEGLAQLSYLIGDDATGHAAVIDPRRDVEVYIELIRARGLRLTHIIETHIHSDFVSGAHELQARTGAEVCGGDGEYFYYLRRLRDRSEISLGGVRLRAMHTPGHTPEHVCLLAFDAEQGEDAFGVFTGDTLVNLDVGRPDLVGQGSERNLAGQLHHSLFKKLVPLADRIEVFPGHGAGSACGKSIGDRLQTTIGHERQFNAGLAPRTTDEFIDWLLADMPEPPAHFARLRRMNAAGAPLRGGIPLVPALSPAELRRRQSANSVVLDCRSMLAFGGGHIPGSINIALGPQFPTWAGRILKPDVPVVLIVDDARDLAVVATHLFRIGHDLVSGYLYEGMTRWQNAGLPLSRIEQWTVDELDQRRRSHGAVVLDVRSDEEWEKGRIPGAQHLFVTHLEEHVGELDPNKWIVTYCGTGYRASLAASLLRRRGFEHVASVPGSWAAWEAAGLPVET